MRRTLSLLTAAFTLALVVGCSEQSEQVAPAAAPGGAPAPTVSVMALSEQEVTHTISLPGRVTAFRQSHVRPQVDGVITERLFEEGAKVEKGQQLYLIDDARYRAQLASAKADLASAKANLKTMQAKADRYEGLLSRNAVSEQEYDDATAQSAQAAAAINVAEAAIEVAQVNLDYTKVYAPISGQISRSYVTVGTLVTANQAQELATITQLDPVYVDMQNSGKAMLEIRKAMLDQTTLPVEIILNESTGEKYQLQGELKFSEVTVDQTTGSVTLRAVLPNPNGLLMPGMFVKAEVIVSTEKQLLVPQRATMRQPDGSLTAFVVNQQNTVEARVVETTRSYKDQYVVTSGLQSGDRVIITGYQKVQPGAQVNAQPWQAGQTRG